MSKDMLNRGDGGPQPVVPRDPEPPAADLAARRSFMLAALSLAPAALLASCAEPDPEQLAQGELALRATGPEHDGPGAECRADQLIERQRRRWRELVDAHMGEENAHDLPGVMDTFSTRGEMIFNGIPFRDQASIAAGHVLFGMSQQPGALVDTQVSPEREYYLDDGVLIEGRLLATHVGDVLGFPGSGRRVSLPYAAIYQFDQAGKLVSERIVMNWLDLAIPPS